jgi:2-dehydro-3-deoxyphosphogluconate aldolase / (4S)-4-hydroxy-2-oxoglutarate aldolase
MKREEVRNRIKEIGIVPAIRVDSEKHALFAAEAVYQGGIPIVEISLTVPGATAVIARLVRQNPQLVVGAGSVWNAKMAQTCLDAGAQFLTSDGLHLTVVEFAAKNAIVVFPGALTPTEVVTAWESGCDFVKVVPCAHIGGEGYMRSLHKMFPRIPLIAAGGVTQQTAPEYILGGAVALGIGGELTPSSAIQRGQPDRIRELARRFAGLVKSARAGKPPQLEGTYIG